MTVVPPAALKSKKQQGPTLGQIPSRKQATKEALYGRLLVARDYIEANYTHSFKLDELARKALISKYHLLRTYKVAFGITPYQHVLYLRLKRAAGLLSKDLSLEEIAQEIGFSDRRSFTKAFRKMYNCSPSEFKKRRRSELG